MNKFVAKNRCGIVLVWALVMVSVATTIVVAFSSYYATSGRIAKFYRDLCVEASTSDSTMRSIFRQFIDLSGKDANKIVSTISSHIDNSGFTDTLGVGFEVSRTVTDKNNKQLDKDDINKAIEKLGIGDTVSFVVSSETKAAHGGISTASRGEMVVDITKRIMSESSEGYETLPVFNHVYFANNYGHIDGSVVANGDIGANDKFTINGSRVNGYVNVRGAYSNDQSAVILNKSPKMWPYNYYMTKVVEKVEADLALSIPGYSTSGVDFYTQIRPTNPIIISDTSNIVWKGGYEPPGYSSRYGEISSSGSLVSVPENPYKDAVLEYSVDNPYQSEYTYYTTEENPLQGIYSQYFDKDGNKIKHDYEDEYLIYYYQNGSPKPNEYAEDYKNYFYDNGSPKPFDKQSDLDALKAERDTYFSSETKYKQYTIDKTNPWDDKSSKDPDCYSRYWTTDKKGKETRITKNPFNKNTQKAKYNAWNNGYDSWAKNGTKYNSYYNWINGKTAWGSGGSKRTEYDNLVKASSEWTTNQNAVKTNYNNWNTKKSKFDSSGKKTAYEQWIAGRDAWIKSDDGLAQYNAWNANQVAAKEKYVKWESEKSEASSKFTEWQRAFEDWYNNLQANGEEVDLNWQTAHLVISNNVKLSNKIINVTTNIYEVPNMSDTGNKMQEIIDFCKTNKSERGTGRIGGYLYCRNRFRQDSGAEIDICITNDYKYHYEYYRSGVFASDSNRYIEPVKHIGLTRTLNEIRVSGGDGSNVVPFKNEDGVFSATASLVKGSVILIGTEKYPIEVDGPIYFPGDVVIRGYISGQGTIYAGRNIHIIGDITYLNPPNWPHKNLSASKNHPIETAKSNRECDLLMLVSRGNIVVGDYTSEIWQSDANMQYLRSYGETSSACNQFSESAIGYNTGFSRDYTANDGGKMVKTSYTESHKSGIGYSIYPLRAWTKDEYTLKVELVNRKYYESLFGAKVISGFKQSVSTDPADGWQVSSSLRQRIKAWLFGGEVTTAGIIRSGSPAAGDITEIDAALVANHGIFGVVGGDGMPQFTLNGAMICRDEGLLPSFSTRFSGYSERKVWLNWDMRLQSDSAEGLIYGAVMKRVNNASKVVYEVKVRSR